MYQTSLDLPDRHFSIFSSLIEREGRPLYCAVGDHQSLKYFKDNFDIWKGTIGCGHKEGSVSERNL